MPNRGQWRKCQLGWNSNNESTRRMHLFVRIVESGSFTAVAEQMGLARSRRHTPDRCAGSAPWREANGA